MNIEKAKKKLRVMLSAPASTYMECTPAVKMLLDWAEAAEKRIAELEDDKAVAYGDGFYDGYWKARSEQAMSSENEEPGRVALLQNKYRDLSQPVDPQISEYEKIMLQAGNSPVIPDGYALVPVEPTDEMVAAAEYEIGADAQSSVDIWNSMFRAALLQAGRVSSNKDKSESEAKR